MPGTSAHPMLEALMAGEQDVEVKADVAGHRPDATQIAELRLALEGRFDRVH